MADLTGGLELDEPTVVANIGEGKSTVIRPSVLQRGRSSVPDCNSGRPEGTIASSASALLWRVGVRILLKIPRGWWDGRFSV